ncbi:MAG: futalosine hydrolase [Bacteroidetes bacterium]|nr:futalosine hydrolase [Bacteroidota bacterium]MBK9523353.1 futalosine hydrolase [Bacteroidota bacterium]MBK9541096.1 futalosine hydrolase [Bacteroidota bacterium]MBP6401477.1 futalosine hydrolase [Bacteroidia bacterium]MBP6649492.1 futalosine hydrolase [Bacteroidia bacterium]
MKILLVSATEAELEPFETIWFRKNQVDRLVSGVGMVATAHSLTRELQSKSYDLAINIGLAGSFDRTFKLGEVVRVVEDIFSELGAEDGENILSLKEMGLSGTDILLNLDETMNPHVNKFRKVRGITVNTVHGNEQSIETIQKRLHPQVETMEGAAFFYVCGKEGVSSLQLRAISNYVEKRNREAWDIPLALANLKTAVTDLLNIL